MPDGDKVHSKLPWRYQRPYKRLCESKTSSQESVWELVKALLQDIQQKGDNFLKTAQLLAEELENHLLTIRFQGNLAPFREDIDKSIKNSNLSHYNQQILIQASHNLLKKIQNNILTNNLKEEMIAESFNITLRINFIGKLPLNQAHYAGVLELTYHHLSRNDIRDLLLNLYRNYIDEWNRVKSKVQATIEDYNHDE